MGEDVDKVVAAYLRSRGFKNAEAAFISDAQLKSADQLAEEAKSIHLEASIPEYILFYNEIEANNPAAYEQSYGRLSKWIEDSMDKYQLELRSVLFPLFVHAYLDLVSRNLADHESFASDHMDVHKSETLRLRTIVTPDHIAENELAQTFLKNRYGVRMSRYSFELLLSFLQDNKFMLLTRVLNRHVSIKVETEKPNGFTDLSEGTGITGLNFAELEEFNKQPVLTGLLPRDPWLISEIEKSLKEETSVHPLKDDILRTIKTEPVDAPSRDAVPLPYPKFSDVRKEMSEIIEMRTRLQLGRSTLPSIASDDSSTVCTGMWDSTLRIWNLNDPAKESKKLIGHAGPVYGVSLSPDNKYAVSCSEDSTVRLWSLQTNSNLVVYKGHNYPVWDVDFSPIGTYMVSGSYDRTAKLWSTDIINPLRIFVGHSGDVDTVKFHPNCNYIATGSSDCQVRLWNVAKGNCVRLLKGHTGTVRSLAFSPDGRLLASGGEDATIKLWDLGTGKLMKSLHGHTNTVLSLHFSRDGSQLASGGADSSVRVWDVNTSSGNDVQGLPKAKMGMDASPEQLGYYPSKRTPIYQVQYSKSNVLLALGAYMAS
ncbi:Transcription initiation factor TFIID subunit 5 [Chytridiales sp. JEL 0842]|nr:Transcription initiation factor TFIID subunit 5 [Chytridiales sp. JEL 0842]